jgi:hypothetical protein
MGDPEMSSEIREQVRDKYAAAARAAASGEACGCGPSQSSASCCGPADLALTDGDGVQVFGNALYSADDEAGAAAAAG